MNKRSSYYRRLIVFTAFCCIALSAAGAPVREIREAQTLMEQGAPGEALERMKELLVDHPEAPEVRFGMGCAWFMLGEQHIASGNAAEAQNAYKEARSVFDALLHHDNAAIAREAAFNRANCTAREAAIVDPAQNYGEAVAALRRAIEAYETALKEYPGHDGIRANLDHVRFLIKQLLQNPPPEDEQQDQQPPDTPPPPILSRFGRVITDIPNANAQFEDDTAILVVPGQGETRP